MPVGAGLPELDVLVVRSTYLAYRSHALTQNVSDLPGRQSQQRVLALASEDLSPIAGTPDDLDQVISECDIVSLHLPLNDTTRQIMSARRIGLMKLNAYLINVARGGLVNQDALFEALTNGNIAGAALDVFAEEPPDPKHPAFQLPNLLITPHIAGGTNGTLRKRGLCIAENLDRIADGIEPLYRVDT